MMCLRNCVPVFFGPYMIIVKIWKGIARKTSFVSEEYFVIKTGFQQVFLKTIGGNLNAMENHEAVVLEPFEIQIKKWETLSITAIFIVLVSECSSMVFKTASSNFGFWKYCQCQDSQVSCSLSIFENILASGMIRFGYRSCYIRLPISVLPLASPEVK